MADSYNIVGFQNHLKFPEQNRVFRLIPGLEQAEFLRFGQIHRNTYIRSPRVLFRTLQARERRSLLFAGQICGVEGYVESIATGLLAGINACRLVQGFDLVVPPRATACGSLLSYISSADAETFQPANISFGLLPESPLESGKRIRDRKERHRLRVDEGLRTMGRWIEEVLRSSVTSPSAEMLSGDLQAP
jgi:methylenetetrahydrofolate--tRNA-(uracil-5-)-methyltransferase